MVVTGFVSTSNLVIREIAHNVNLQAVAVYLVILSHRKTVTGKCFPSMGLLGEELNISVAGVKRYVKALADAGYLIIDSGKQGISNTYYFPYEPFYKGEGNLASRRKKGNFKSNDRGQLFLK